MGILGTALKDKRLGRAFDAIAILFFAFFVLGPLFFIFTKLGHFEFTGAMQEALLTSFGIAFAVTAIDVVFGVPLAWLLARKRFPFREVVDALVDLPLIIPTSALGLSIALFWGSSGLGILSPGLAMIIVLHVAFTFSYVVRTTQAAILEIDPDVARAAGTLGASPFLAFRSIWLPLLRAGIVSGAILAFTRSLGETGATMIVAGAFNTVPILTVYFKNSTPPDINSAISLSVVFLTVSAALFLFLQTHAGLRRFRLGKVFAGAEKRLSSLGWLSDAGAVLFLFLAVLLPSFYFLKFTDFAFFSQGTVDSIIASFAIAGAATGLSIAFGLPLALFIASKSRFSWLVRLLNEMCLLMPTVTIGLSISLFWAGRLDGMPVLVLAHLAMIFPYFVSPVAEALSEMDESLPQVARSLGASPLYALRTVVLPLVKHTVLAGMVVAFVRSVSETGGTLAVSTDITTIPVLIVNLSKGGQYGQAASAAALLLAVSLIIVLILRTSQRKKW